jgi:hypothetical protein
MHRSGQLMVVLALAGDLCDTEWVLTDPFRFRSFRFQAAEAESVVRVREALRTTDNMTPLVHLEVVENVAGKPIQESIVVAAAVWDVVAPWTLRRETTTFLLNMGGRGEIMCIQVNGIPTEHGDCSGIVPIVSDAIPKAYVTDYDSFSCADSIPMSVVREQLTRKASTK